MKYPIFRIIFEGREKKSSQKRIDDLTDCRRPNLRAFLLELTPNLEARSLTQAIMSKPSQPAFTFCSIFLPANDLKPKLACLPDINTATILITQPRSSANPTYLTPLLEAARTKLEPIGLSVPSLTWQSPCLTITIEQIADNKAPTASDCARATSQLTDLLDCNDFFDDIPYTLEVSSPGASDSLRYPHEFAAFKGFPVRVIKVNGAQGPPVVLGRLGDVDDQIVCVNIKGRRVKVRRDVVESISLCTEGDIGESNPS